MRRLVLTLLALAAAFPSATAAHAPRAWMTTGDKTNLLTEQPRSALGAPVAGAPTITADPRQTFQRIEGFGASITDSSATLHWHTRFLTVGAVRNWAKTVITWNLALDPANGPHNGGCDTCKGVVTIDPATGRATREADYYVLGHVTKFVRPGPARIGSSVADTIWDVAFRNPDGSVVLLAVNDDWGTGSKRFNVRLGRSAFSYDLPAGAVVTFALSRN